MRRLLHLLLLLAAIPIVNAAVPLRPIAHQDLWLMKRVGAPQVSPDGRWSVVSVTEPAYAEKDQVSDLWLIATDASTAPRRLTGTAGRESGVTWSADSQRIAFSARREGDEVEQIYVLAFNGGDALRVTNSPGGARAPRLSPDGRQLLFASTVYPGAKTAEENRKAAAERKIRGWNARIYDGFPIRNWDRWLDELATHLFVTALPSPGAVASEARDLFAGTRLASGAGFSGRIGDGGEEFDGTWSPDGAAIVFAASTDRDRAAFAFTSTNLYRVAVSGGEPVALTRGPDNWSRPQFSADGRSLYALVERQTERVYNKAQLGMLVWPRPAEPRFLTRDFDRSITSFAVTPDSRDIYLLAEEAGHEKLYLQRAGRPVQRVFDMAVGVYANLVIPQRATAPLLLANFESATQPPEVVRIDASRGTHQLLSAFSTQQLKPLDLPPLQHFWFTSSTGRRVHSMLLVPPQFDASRKYPLFNVLHGGPHNMWRDQWVLRWNYHLLTAPGYVVLLTNYGGSTGFGEVFAQAIQRDPLRGPAIEINEAADEAIRRFSFIDGARQCAGGASYGGHLANWMQASTTRYRCLVSHAGLVNLESQWGTSDTVYGREINNGGPVWEQGPVWREQNPIRYAARFATPTLVTVGEQDFRVPLNNSLEYWTVLQRRRIPSRLVVFPDENHWVLQGENSRLFYKEVHAWLGRYLPPP